MIVSGGKIIAIGKAHTDGVTLSGNGVETPLGINEKRSTALSSTTTSILGQLRLLAGTSRNTLEETESE